LTTPSSRHVEEPLLPHRRSLFAQSTHRQLTALPPLATDAIRGMQAENVRVQPDVA